MPYSNKVFIISLLGVASGGIHISRHKGVAAFTSPIFVQQEAAIKAPSKKDGVDIELPDFDELFSRIQKVSPLAKLAMQERDGGFFVMDDESSPDLNWGVVEANKRKIVHYIDKIDNYQDLGCPIVRFRASLEGPCIGECFARFIMNLDDRKKWDKQIVDVEELYPVKDLETINDVMGHKYGECTKLGIGYCRTKDNFVVSPREQLTLCGIQDFPSTGATVIWGTEMEDRHNHLLPPGERQTRARSHLFSTALVPTGKNSFDVEYVLQLEVGGKIPTFMTTAIVSDTVRSLFKYAKKFYSGELGGEIEKYLEERNEPMISQ